MVAREFGHVLNASGKYLTTNITKMVKIKQNFQNKNIHSLIFPFLLLNFHFFMVVVLRYKKLHFSHG